MGFSSDFDDVMTQTVTVKTLASRNSDGSAAYSTATSTFAARVVNTNRQIRDASGNVVMGQYDVWIASTGTIAANSKITLPDGTAPPILLVHAYPDENGSHYHNKVTFGY